MHVNDVAKHAHCFKVQRRTLLVAICDMIAAFGSGVCTSLYAWCLQSR